MKKILLLTVCVFFVNLHLFSQNWVTFNSTNTSNGLPNNFIHGMVIDSLGNKWFGTYGYGLTKFDGQNWNTYTTSNGLVHNTISIMELSSSGEIWIGTDGGISILSGTQYKNFTTSNGLPNNLVRAIVFDSNGMVWVGTWGGGVCRYNGSSWETFNKTNGLVDNYVKALVVDQYGNIWIGTQYGISKYDGTSFTTYNTSNTNLANNYIRAAVMDKSNNVWFCTFGGGVTKFTGSSWITYKAVNGLCNNKINAVAVDLMGNIWFGGDAGGVSKFDGTNWTTYNTSNSGLAQDVILSLRPDNVGNMWFGLWGQGVSRFNYLADFKLELGPDQYICAGLSTTIRSEKWFETYSWSNGSISDSAIIDSSGVGIGVKKIKLSATFLGQNYSDSVFIHFVKPKADAGSNQTVCADNQVDLLATGGVNYKWNTGETTSSISFKADKTSKYTITVTDQYGCSDTASVWVHVNPRPAKPNIVLIGNDTLKSSVAGTSYNWLLNKSKLPQTTDRIKPLQSGIYQVIVFINDCASDTSAGVEFQSNGIATLYNEKEIFIYPNPAYDILTVKLNNIEFSNSRLEIVSVIGEILFKSYNLSEVNKINVTGLSQGIYYLKLYHNGLTTTEKFVVR